MGVILDKTGATDQSLYAYLAGASVEQRQRDACGRISYEDYIQPGTNLTRQIQGNQ